MAKQVGDKELEFETNDLEKVAHYKLVKYPANQLPGEYRNLVIAPFKTTLRYGNDLFKLIDKEAYFEKYSKYIDILLQRPDSIITLAVLDDVILGWCLYERTIVHYIWVKKEVRRQGIGQALLPKYFGIISHITNIGLKLWANYYPLVRFDPFV
jgi:GNAT superfamily N-acetyltransferase